MDNRIISIQSIGKNDFDLAMKLVIGDKKTVGYGVVKNSLVLYWHNADNVQILPYEMDAQEATNFAWGWLCKNKPSAEQPDHDGDNKIGFRVFNEAWGYVYGESAAYVAIEPIWAMYGK